MKKQMAFLACLSLALCMPAFAQTSDAGNSQTKSDNTGQSGSMKSGKMMGKKMSATGCVAEKDGKYMLMNKQHPDGISLMSSEDLQPHVGHKVKLTGMMDMGSMMNGEKKSDETSGGDMGMMTMKVTSLKMISTQCEMGGMMKK